MPDVWYPNAERVDVGPGCGSMVGGPARVTHHTTEGGTAEGAISTYRNTGDYPTFTIQYDSDKLYQHVSVDLGSTALVHTSGQMDTNRMGSVNIQIEWVGYAQHPFTDNVTAGPNVRGFFDWLRSWGVPDVWPNGAPLAYPASYGDNGQRDLNNWKTQAGHYAHSQVPENSHGDPGAIDPAFIKQTNDAQEEDIVASIDDLRKVVQEEIAKAVSQLHNENVLILHGDSSHPASIDSILKAVQAKK
jgi:hypothetical protein